MNNLDIPVLFVARRIKEARNGRGNFRFRGDILYSFDDVVAMFVGAELLVSADTFSATSSRHQSAVKRVADKYTLVPDLTALVTIMRDRKVGDINRYVAHRKMVISEYERKIDVSRSDKMVESHMRRIAIERDAIRRALRYLPFELAVSEGARIFSG